MKKKKKKLNKNANLSFIFKAHCPLPCIVLTLPSEASISAMAWLVSVLKLYAKDTTLAQP